MSTQLSVQVSANSGQPQRVCVLVLPHVNLLDLAGPVQVFSAASELGASYQLLFCAQQEELSSAQGLVFAKLQPLPTVTADDLILVPGPQPQESVFRASPEDGARSRWLREAYKAGAQITSICTGAFVLAEAGLLNGRRCTTHWMAVSNLQTRYPRAHVLDSSLFVHDGRITTSAGIASGIDMALSLLEAQQGPLFTAHVARYLVVYLRRNGVQPQNSVYLQYRTHINPIVHQAQDYVIEHLSEAVSLPVLAEMVQTSTRTLTRAFKEATGLTPVQYHQNLQLEMAAMLLNNPALSIEEVAHKTGFEDARHFRRLWLRQFGVSPSISRKLGQSVAAPRSHKKHGRQGQPA